MSQNGHEERSCAERAGASHAAHWAGSSWPVLRSQRRPRRRPKQPSIPLLIHLSPAPSRALPHVAIRPVRTADQRHGHRQYLRAGCEAAVLRGGMGAEHSLLPRTPSDRPSRAVKARLVGAVRPQRIPVLHAATRGPFTRRRWAACIPHGGGPSSRLHGPHQDLPGASGEAESPPRGLRGILLPEGDRPLHDRCVRPVRRTTHRELAREISMRPRGVLQKSVPQPADALRETAPPAALSPDSQLPSHRTTLLREASRQDADRDTYPGHAALWELVLMAVHGDHVTYDVATPGSCLIDALRLPAVPLQPAFRLPTVPA